MVVKIPMTAEGLKAVKVLTAEGIKTNVTLIFYSKSGAFWLPEQEQLMYPHFLGRLDDISTSGVELIRTIADMFCCGRY